MTGMPGRLCVYHITHMDKVQVGGVKIEEVFPAPKGQRHVAWRFSARKVATLSQEAP